MIKGKILQYICVVLVMVSSLSAALHRLDLDVDMFSYQAGRIMFDNMAAVTVNGIVRELAGEQSEGLPDKSPAESGEDMDAEGGGQVAGIRATVDSVKFFMLGLMAFFVSVVLGKVVNMQEESGNSRLKKYLLRALGFMTPLQEIIEKLAQIYDSNPAGGINEFSKPAPLRAGFFYGGSVHGNPKR